MQFCRNAEMFILSRGITVLKIKGFVVFKNFQVISMRFAIFLCYCVEFF